MKITAQDMDAKKTALDDDAAIYGKRDEKDAKETFASLEGKEKWEYFKDYILGKLVIIAVVAVFSVYLLYSVFGPKPESLLYLAVIDDPLGTENVEKLQDVLTQHYVKDPKKEKVTVDASYYFVTEDYNARMKFMTLTAAKEVDFCIIPQNEIENYMDSDIFAALEDVMGADALDKYASRIYKDPVSGKAYGIDVSSMINSTLGFEAVNDYYAVCIINSPHREGFADFVDFILGN